MTEMTTMDAAEIMRKHLEEAGPDQLREVVRFFAEGLMSAEADALCGAAYGERSAERVNQRNGYRQRRWDTRAGTIELAIPKVRRGSYFPGWLLEPRRRAERALMSVIAECYVKGVSTRKVDKLDGRGRSSSVSSLGDALLQFPHLGTLFLGSLSARGFFRRDVGEVVGLPRGRRRPR